MRAGRGAIWTLAAIVTLETLGGIGVLLARVGAFGADPGRAVARGRPAVALPARPSGEVPLPEEIEIPSIGVRAALVNLSIEPDGTLPAPEKFDEPGWWSQGTRPGGQGPAVIVGHRDSLRGPAVFFGVARLDQGDAVSVRRADGSQVTFLVQEKAQFSKGRFPTERVYGPTDRPTLRLITCGGRFDRTVGQYDDNVVVFATLAEPASPDPQLAFGAP